MDLPQCRQRRPLCLPFLVASSGMSRLTDKRSLHWISDEFPCHALSSFLRDKVFHSSSRIPYRRFLDLNLNLAKTKPSVEMAKPCSFLFGYQSVWLLKRLSVFFSFSVSQVWLDASNFPLIAAYPLAIEELFPDSRPLSWRSIALHWNPFRNERIYGFIKRFGPVRSTPFNWDAQAVAVGGFGQVELRPSPIKEVPVTSLPWHLSEAGGHVRRKKKRRQFLQRERPGHDSKDESSVFSATFPRSVKRLLLRKKLVKLAWY